VVGIAENETELELSPGAGAVMVVRVWLFAVGVGVTSLFAALAGLFSPWILTGTAAAAITTIIASWWYPVKYVDSICGHFDGAAVHAEHGVFWRQKLYVPVSALRTVEHWQTPLQRYCHCCTVTLRFAGGGVVLSMLSDEQGERLVRATEHAVRKV